MAALPRDPLRIAAELVETLVPRWADHAAFHILDESRISEAGPKLAATRPGSSHTAPGHTLPSHTAPSHTASSHTVLRRIAVAPAPQQAPPTTPFPAGEVLRAPAQSPVLNALSNGETVHVPHMDSLTADHLATQLGTPERAARLRGRSILLIPLIADATLLGNVMLVRDPGRLAFEEQAIAAVEAIVHWATLALVTGCSSAPETWLGDALRRELRPDRLPALPELELHYRYLPESRTVQIGGDWFDVIPLACGRIALVIGDVMGHGVDAALVMNRCKTVVRTLALLGMSPDQVLGRFDRHFAELACQYGDECIATCLIAIYDPATGQCQTANAGQIPPILVHPDGHTTVLEIPTGAPIGAAGPAFRTRTLPLGRGSILALCTDGFTTLHHADIDHALTGVRATLTDPGRPLAEICDDVFHGIDTELRSDDVTFVLARLLGGPAPGSA